jgi:hypothetical protein
MLTCIDLYLHNKLQDSLKEVEPKHEFDLSVKW